MKSKTQLENENKILNDEISQLEKGLCEVEKSTERTRKIIREKRAQIIKNNEKIKNFGRTLTISDHALMRFIERKTGISIEELKKEFLPPGLVQLIGDNRDVNVTFQGVKYIVKDYTIVTVL